jgi:hypothetical protein
MNIEPCCAGGTCDPLSPLFIGEPDDADSPAPDAIP